MASQNEIVVMRGKRGAGKSSFAGWLACNLEEHGKASSSGQEEHYRGLAYSLLILNHGAFEKVRQAKHEYFLRLLAAHPSIRSCGEGYAG